MTSPLPRPLLACFAGLALGGCVYAAEPVVVPAPVYVAPRPPPPAVVVRPAPRRVWVPGHYGRNGRWIPGHWRWQ